MKHSKNTICIVRHGYYPGDSRVFKEVSALRDAGFHVDVICLRQPGEMRKEYSDGVKIYRLSHKHERGSLLRYFYEYGLSFLKMFFLVTLLFFRRSYKCIQVNTMPDFLVLTTIIPHLLGAKILLDMHEPMPELFVTKYGENKYVFIFKLIILIEQLAIKYADAILTVNNTICKRFIERGADEKKISIVRNVPDEGYFNDTRKSSSKSGFTLLNHGTINTRYGQEVIIRALPLIRDKIDGLKLFIVGDGENTGPLHSLTEELGCADIVTFTGHVPLSQIGELIGSADVGIVPLLRSPFSELCQPNKLFEYIAYKKPVITSRLKAIEESLNDSHVIFFEPGDYKSLARCILDLYHNPENVHELTETAYQRYEIMRWAVTKKHYLNVFVNLIDKRE